jgi:hypothetical protein
VIEQLEAEEFGAFAQRLDVAEVNPDAHLQFGLILQVRLHLARSSPHRSRCETW